jgi:CHAD domain-containing protein
LSESVPSGGCPVNKTSHRRRRGAIIGVRISARRGSETHVMKAIRDDSLALYAAKAVLKRTRTLGREVRGARDGADTRAVHDLRVASRRLSTTLALFEDQFPRRRGRAWSRRLKRFRRALGKIRDLDVQKAFLEDFLRESEEFLGGMAEVEYRPGIKRLLGRVRRRSARRRKAPKALARLEKHGVLPELKRAAKDLRAAARGGRADGPAVRRRAEAAILDHLQALLALEPCLDRPEAAAEHHAMRIAAKRLRYTLEVFRPLYGARVARFVSAARGCQQRLGEIHDCDVWVESLPQFLKEEEARPGCALARPGILFLQDERRRRRRRLWKDFIAFWHRLRRDRVWERLAEFVRAEPAAGRRPSAAA